MQLSLAALVAAAFTSLASAYTQPVGAQPSGNPTSHPALAEQVPVGLPFDITWTPTTPGTVTILLLNGPSTNIQVLYPIVEKIANSGSYSWTPKTNLVADVTHYGIQIIDDATGAYQYSPQFGIKNTASASGSTASATGSTAGSTSAPPASSGSGSGSAAPATHTAASTAPPTTTAPASTTAPGTLSTVRASTATVATAWSNSTTSSPTGSVAVTSTPTAPSSSRAGRVVANAAAALAAVGALALLVL